MLNFTPTGMIDIPSMILCTDASRWLQMADNGKTQGAILVADTFVRRASLRPAAMTNQIYFEIKYIC